MTPQQRKRIILIAIGLVLLILIIFAFLPDAVPVETAEVTQAPLQVTVEEEGRTEVAERYAITAPVSAFLRRIELEVGDIVAAGAPVIRLEPPRTPILDPAARTEAAARVRAAQAVAREATRERERVARLAAAGAATRQQLEQAVSEASRANAEVAAAQAALRRTEGTSNLPVQRVLTAPAGGRVLAVRRESEGQVNPGDTLLVIGDARSLEVRTEVLSEDAVRIRPGMRVLIEQWGGDTPLAAVVQRVEPQGFTTISSLGVEEQRVTVLASMVSSPEFWSRLGAGYRVVARFIIWEAPSVLQVPTSALFRVGNGWAVFAVEDGRAVRKAVTIGQQGGLSTQVVSGLQAGAEVIVHPSNEIEDGVRVKAQREAGE